jgi:thymidylate synthase (FAD)|tara:strand:+ start:1352 stop:2059 length:708 start_codon:yes stop_codon:yes gene_type:complete
MNGSVKLIAHTTPISSFRFDTDQSTMEDLVAYMARVSNPNNQNNTATARKLIKYLVKHKHWSPLEMVNVVLEIETTRDIGRQILRHRSFSFQEFSQRYADPTSDLEFVMREARLQDDKNRQNSLELDDKNKDHNWLISEWETHQNRIINYCNAMYTWATQHGIAKEQARAVLPEGMTMSRMYMNGSLRSWIHYIQLRTDPSTQKEHREIAQMCAFEIAKVFPLIKDILGGESENE